MNREQLIELLTPYLPDAQVLTDLGEEASLFDAGLDSMNAFLVLDDLAAAGYRVEFTDFIARPTLGFLGEATA